MISMCTQGPALVCPENAITRRLPIPALTCLGTAGAIAFITVSAKALPGQKRAITGAGKIGLARHPSGAWIVIGRVRPLFCGMLPYLSLSSRIDRSVSQTAQSTVPTSGMLIGLCGVCGAVPVRSTNDVTALDCKGDFDRQFLQRRIVAVEIAVV